MRGVGLVSGGALPVAQRGRTLHGLMHAADWMPTLLTWALKGNMHWKDIALQRAAEPPFELGDGVEMLVGTFYLRRSYAIMCYCTGVSHGDQWHLAAF